MIRISEVISTWRIRVFVIGVVAMWLGTALGSASAAGGDAIWVSQYDSGLGNDLGSGVAVQGNRVYASYVIASGASSDFGVRAMNASTGQVLWSDAVDGFGGSDTASAVTVDGNNVIAVGYVANANGDRDAFIRAYDGASGNVIWTTRYDTGGGDFAFAVAVEGKRVLVAGRADCSSDAPAVGCKMLALALDGANGQVVWSDVFGPETGFGSAGSIAVAGNRMAIAGHLGDCSVFDTSPCNFAVRTYDIGTGGLVWSDEFNLAGGYDAANRIASSGGRFYAAGRSARALDDSDFIVRAYDSSNGTLIWMDQLDVAGGRDEGRGIAVEGNRVVATGFVRSDPGLRFDALTRGYDASTGAVIWTDVYDFAGLADTAFRVTTGAGRAYVDLSSEQSDANNDMVLRTLDIETGAPVWTTRFDLAGGNEASGVAALSGKRIYVVGNGEDPIGDNDVIIEALEAR